MSDETKVYPPINFTSSVPSSPGPIKISPETLEFFTKNMRVQDTAPRCPRCNRVMPDAITIETNHGLMRVRECPNDGTLWRD